MSEEQRALDILEWHLITTGEQFYDDLEHRLFINGSKHDIKLGFGHDIRKRETILITVEEAEIGDPKLNALEGEIIEE